MDKENHWIIEWFELEGTLKTIQLQPPCHGQGHLPLDQAAQSLIHPDLEHFQGGLSTISPGNLFQHLTTLTVKKFFLISNLNFFQFKAITPCPTTTCPRKKSLSSFLVRPLQLLKGCSKVSPQPSLLLAEQPFRIGEVLQPSDHLCGPPLDPLQQVHVFLVLRAPELEAGFQVRSHQSRVEQQNHLPWPAGHASLDAAQDTVGLLGF